MNKTKKYILLIILIFFLVIANYNSSFAKYEIEETMVIANLEIDNTKPVVEVIYSTKDITNQNVKVSIISNEPIKDKEGWILDESKKILTKAYQDNINESIQIEDLSGNVSNAKIQIDNIDKSKPKIEIEKIENSNAKYPKYANTNAEILITLKIEDDNLTHNQIDISNFKIYIENKEINPNIKELTYIKKEKNEEVILIKLSQINQEGKLFIHINEGTIEDVSKNKNKEIMYDTGITIDNTNPIGKYSQEKIEQGKVSATVTANEKIRKLEGWNIKEERILNKIFKNNVSYEITLEDLAGNLSKVKVDVTKATYVILSYASHNSAIGWSYGYGNYDIAGENAIKEDPIFKTESLAFNILGNVEKDFLQAKAFVYTHWGVGSKAKCLQTGKIYSYGINPTDKSWKTMLSEGTINLNQKQYMQFGGAGINGAGVTDINGNGEISMENAFKFLYGISSIQLKLKSYDEYSIVYQIYVKEVGWLKTSKNEEVACYRQDKPMSAIRVALIPKTEERAIIELWDKDEGKKINN